MTYSTDKKTKIGNVFAAKIFLFAMLSSSPLLASDYRITTSGDLTGPAGTAVDMLARKLKGVNSEISLEFIPGLSKASELTNLLENEVIDIAVVPFEAVPALASSPLLEPFLAQDATAVRQAIDSEVGAYEKADVERDGLRVLDFWHVSSTIFGSKTPVLQVQDLRGVQVADPSAQASLTLQALGAAPIQMAVSDIFPALERGALDSSPVPLDQRAQAFGFNQIVTHYVDRLYKPALYAVLITEKRWSEIDYPDQYELARAATRVGEELVSRLETQALAFKQGEISRGAFFNAWNAEDIDQVRLASLSVVNNDADIEKDLIDIAYASAAAASKAPKDDDAKPRPAATVELLFATDRKLVGYQRPETAFSSDRKLRGLNFGIATVRLVDRRRFGDDLEDVAKIERLSPLTEALFVQRISNDSSKQIVVFVHGYNNAFAASVRRGSTIKEDIAPGSIVISYTWPSDGALLSYGYDESSTDTAEQNFRLLMKTLTDNVPSSRINIVAHSMGSRLLTKFIAGLPERNIKPDTIKFRYLIFAAPDISTEFFRQKQEEPLLPNYPISEYAERITIYSSQYDRPLGLSQMLHRDQRLGLSDETNMYLATDIIAVDASPIDPAKWYQKFSFATRHSYVFDKAAGVRDMSLLLAGNEPASRPGMIRKTRSGLPYWVLTP